MIEDSAPATDGEGTDPFADMRAAKPWLDAIAAYDTAMAKYNDTSDKIDKLYADLESMAKASGERQMQIFWANLEVLKPSIYSRPPVPVVTSRFKDRKELNRHAAEIIERALITSFDTEDIDSTMRLLRDDVATNARGVVWLRYKKDDKGERVCYDHIDRKDFAHEIARKWKEVGWVARRSWLTREQGLERFDEEWLKATFTNKMDDADEDSMQTKKAMVWEIWSKDQNAVIWVTSGVDAVLDIQEPFLTLDNFFPCPRPAYGTTERGSLKPVPDFVYYRDQVEEINELTARISALAEALRLRGFYSAGVDTISDAVEIAIKSTDNNAVLIPVTNTAALGGAALKDSIVWLPVREVAEVIVQLIGLRKQLIEDVYQITGLSDIMRGATDPNETLGAQQLKSQYGSVRVRDRQNELIRVARDITRIAGEIIAENFDPQTVLAMSQYEDVPQAAQIQQQVAQIQQQVQQKVMEVQSNPELMKRMQQDPKMKEQAEQALQQAQAQIKELQSQITLEQVFEFIADQRMRPFSLDIETDSTIQPDEEANKESVTQFMGALATALAQLGPMVAAQPESAPFAAEVLKFATTPFRAGRPLEAAIDDFADKMKQASGQPKPNPEAEKMKAEGEKAKAEFQMRAQESKAAHDLKIEEMKAGMAVDSRKMEIEAQKAGLEREKIAMEIQKITAEIERINAQTTAAKAKPEKAAA